MQGCIPASGPADLQAICRGQRLEGGRCYAVLLNASEEFPETCLLQGPDNGLPAVFVSAENGTLATLGNSTVEIVVRGRVQLTEVRLAALNLNVSGAQLGVCPHLVSPDDAYHCGAEVTQGGGISVKRQLQVDGGSNVSVVRACTAGKQSSSEVDPPPIGGGGVYVGDDLLLEGRSWLHIGEARAWNPHNQVGGTPYVGSGGGLLATVVHVTAASRLHVADAFAGRGGGIYANTLTVDEGGRLEVAGASAEYTGGGIHVTSDLTVSSRGSVAVVDSRAGVEGGGFYVRCSISVADSASLEVRTAEAPTCGGFSQGKGCTSLFPKRVQVAGGSSLLVTGSIAYETWGGGICAEYGMEVTNASVLRVADSHARMTGGAFISLSGGLEVRNASNATFTNISTDSGADCYLRCRLGAVEGSLVNFSGASGSARIVEVDGGSRLHMDWNGVGATLSVDLWTQLQNKSEMHITGVAGSALQTPRLHVGGGSLLSLRAFVGTTGLHLGPPLLSAAAAQTDTVCLMDAPEFGTLLMEEGSSVEATNCQAAVALLSVDASGEGTLNVSHLRVRGCKGQLGLVRGAKRVVVADVDVELGTDCSANASCDTVLVDYSGEVEFSSVGVRCPRWSSGCEVVLEGRQLLVIGGSNQSECTQAASVAANTTDSCTCLGMQTPAPAPIGRKQRSVEYCRPCLSNHFYDSGTHSCKECPWYCAWSRGGLSPCLLWPGRDQEGEFLGLFLPAALVVGLSLWMGVIISSPLYITDMSQKALTEIRPLRESEKSRAFARLWHLVARFLRRAAAALSALLERGCDKQSARRVDPTPARTALVLSVQGALMDLPVPPRLLWYFLRYRVEGSGAYGVDYQPGKQNVFRLKPRSGRTVQLVGPGAELDRASSQGRLLPQGWRWMLACYVSVWAVVILLPAWRIVVVLAGEEQRVAHVGVTLVYMTSMWGVFACLVGPIWKRGLDAQYSSTHLVDLHKLYRQTIQREPYEGPDADHPQYAGLTAGVLFDTFDHYRAVVLDRNMHYVVANIVLPLTKPQRVSFATLWGGRTVMHFVSHSWGTVHATFVNTIRCHAEVSAAGSDWRAQTYWICSFSNNQWDISAALGETVMESAFARVLTGGLVRKVAMVLDADVQPLHRVWCLFELLVSNDQHLEVQYATAVGIIGDHRCASVDIPIAIAQRVGELRVAECEASDPEDKRKILAEITERMSSLEAMDSHISRMMAASLERSFGFSQEHVSKTVRKLKGQTAPAEEGGVPASAAESPQRIVL